MIWILSDVLDRKRDTDVKLLLPYFDAIRTHPQKEAMRVLISVLLETSQTNEVAKALMVVQKMQSVLKSLEDAAIFEMLPYIFHCFDMEDPTLTEQTFRLLNVIVQKTCSTLLVNSIYTSLHTLFSANGYLTQKQFPLLIPSLYRRLSTSVSPAKQFNENCLAELRSIYFRLCEDTRLVIRRQASRQFFACFSAFGAAYRPTFLSHLHVFLHDDV
ncbi:hypothetical protein WA588_000110, partial [Blastocystis sp. NMH]